MNIPEGIQRHLNGGFSLDTVGKSGSQVLCFADRVLKVQPAGEEADTERDMLHWLNGRLPVPRILCAEEADDMSYLLMERAAGEMACSEDLLRAPGRLAALLADALRMLWEVEPAGSPGCRGLQDKLRQAEARVAGGVCDVLDVEPGTYGPGGFEGPPQLLAWLQANRPPEEDLVFSHGDFCLPSIFAQSGRVSGLIDWGRGGVADRYQDIALCYRSLHHNLEGAYGGERRPGAGTQASLLFQALGIQPDWHKLRYYTLLDELF